MVLARELLEAGANPNHMEEVSIVLRLDLTLLQHAQPCVGLLYVCLVLVCCVCVSCVGLLIVM